ncbi:MAG: hypothetical protein AAGN66_07555 [Acidobacteriota bacterium]
MKRHTGALIVAALLVAPGALLAADGNASTAASGHKGLYNLIYGENLCHGQWAFSTYYNKWDRRVQSDPVTLAIDPLWTDWDMDVERASIAIGYGLTDKVELALMLPHWSYDGESIDGENRSSGILNGRLFNQGVINQSGLGNLRLGAKFELNQTDFYATAVNAFVDLPTGDDDESVVTGDTGFGLGFAYNNANGWVFNAGYFAPGDSDFGDVSDEVSVGVGYAKDYGKTEWITELAGTLYTESNGEHDNADLTSGGRWRVGDKQEWAVNAALRVDLSDTGFDYSPVGGLVGLSFAPKNRYDLTVTNEGSGTGTVTSSDNQIDCGSDCAGKYHCGANVTLTATPDPKSRFDGWTGDCAGGPDQTSVTLTLDGDKTCGAKYVKLYDVTVEIGSRKHPDGDDPGKGKVEIAGPGGNKVCTDKCTMTYDVGTKVDLQAMPEDKSTFGGWTVDCSGDDPSTAVTLDGDKTCVATFVGPPRPCVDQPITGDYAKCGRYKSSWTCDSATFSAVVEGYTKNGFDLPAAMLPTDENERKTPLCDLVNFMRACPEFNACIAGREDASENHCTAEERAARVAGFLQAQSTYPFFADITPDRYQLSPACRAEDGTGMSVEIFLDK